MDFVKGLWLIGWWKNIQESQYHLEILYNNQETVGRIKSRGPIGPRRVMICKRIT